MGYLAHNDLWIRKEFRVMPQRHPFPPSLLATPSTSKNLLSACDRSFFKAQIRSCGDVQACRGQEAGLEPEQQPNDLSCLFTNALSAPTAVARAMRTCAMAGPQRLRPPALRAFHRSLQVVPVVLILQQLAVASQGPTKSKGPGVRPCCGSRKRSCPPGQWPP